MTKRDIFIQACLQFLTLPYKWGGDDPIKGYDCSGLIQELFSFLGLDPKEDQTAQGLYEYFKPRSISTVKTGTLCFYGSSVFNITHVGMIIDGDYMMLEAGGGNSSTNTLEAAANQNAYVRIRPYHLRKDLVAILTPSALPW